MSILPIASLAARMQMVGAVAILLTAVVYGAIPPDNRPPACHPPADAVFLEAETFRSMAGWEVDSYNWNASTSYYMYPSGLKALRGPAGTAGGQSDGTALIPRAGRYRLWVRCLNIPQAPYTLAISQNGNATAAAEFDGQTPRISERVDLLTHGDPPTPWGTGTRGFVWWHLDADLNAGPCQLRLTMGTASDYPRYVDCIAFTTDLAYTPQLVDFARPLYLRVRIGPRHHPLGGAIFFKGRIENSYPPYFSGGAVYYRDLIDFITKDGLYSSAALKDIPADFYLKPGATTPWMNIAPYLDLRGQRMRFTVYLPIFQLSPTADFTIDLSHDPTQPPFKSFHREGTGASLVLMIDPMKPEETKSDIEWSALCRRRAEQAPAPPRGRQPERFALFTGLSDNPDFDAAQEIRNDMLAIRALGFTGTTTLGDPQWMKQHGLRYMMTQTNSSGMVREPGCLNQPRPDVMKEQYAAHLSTSTSAELPPFFFKLQDEVSSVEFIHLKTCAFCATKFRRYLQGLGLTPRELLGDAVTDEADKDSWEAVRPTDDKRQARLYYYTSRFRTRALVDFYTTATGVIGQIKPGLRTTASTSIELTYCGNLLENGVDIFDLYKSNALTYGLSEDATSGPPSPQTASMMMDFYRSACKYRRQPYGTYNFIWIPPWDYEAKAFMEIGHGISSLHFYDYGPWHSDSSDPQSQFPSIYPALKEINYVVGAIENDLAGAVVPPAKIALLYSHTTDIWTWHAETPYVTNSGYERLNLYLLLKHLGYPIDILTEDDILEGRTKGYLAIFTAESHMKAGVVPKLLEWVKNGGSLYAIAGAARFNQFNEPVQELETTGLRRDSFVFRGVQDTVARINCRRTALDAAGGYQKVLAGSAGRPVQTFTDGAAAAINIACGKGRLLYMGYFPGTSYVRDAISRRNREQAAARDAFAAAGRDEVDRMASPSATLCATWYPGDYRRLLQELLDPLGCPPPVRVSNCLVEANLLAGKQQFVLSLANFSGTPGKKQRIQVSVDLPYRPGMPRSVLNPLRGIRRAGNTIAFTLEIGPGDFIVLPKAK